MGTYLDAILRAHRERAAHDGRSGAELRRHADSRATPVRDFRAALAGETLGVIAEIKRRSPSRGDLAADVDAGVVAKEYAAGGACALSVLTDGPHFGGSPDDLRAARSACDVPVLRKDFTVAACDVYDAFAMGADAILLIVAALDQDELASLHALATDLGLAALVEAHDEPEVERALQAGASIVGVNQRDLFTFTVDTTRATRVCGAIPGDVLRVAESGITSATVARDLASAGYDAILVGEHLVTSPDRSAAVRELCITCS